VFVEQIEWFILKEEKCNWIQAYFEYKIYRQSAKVCQMERSVYIDQVLLFLMSHPDRPQESIKCDFSPYYTKLYDS